MKLTSRQILGYAVLPKVIPMVRDLFGSGFGHVAFFMAQIYGTARLLPANHPYLNSSNIGRFGVSGVLIEATRNLRMDRKHIDQVVIYFALLTGFILLVAQFALLGFGMFVQAGHANNGGGYAQFFVTQNPVNDVAFLLLDRVFGIPDMFGSCVSLGQPCLNDTVADPAFPMAYHGALHNMLAFYSVGLCVIGMLILMYYIVAIVVETAQAGTPFGRRYNHVWAPIRLVVALGLLIPLTYGLNGAQWLTLYVAKWGSSLATNGWNNFVVTATGGTTLLGVQQDLVGEPQKPNPGAVFQFYTVLGVCKKIYENYQLVPYNINAYLVQGTGAAQTSMPLDGTSWQQASQFYNNGDIIVVFGEQNAELYPNEKGNVMPYCGEIVLPATDLTEPGAVTMQTDYYENIIKRYWDNVNGGGAITGGAAALPTGPQDFFFNSADRIIEMALSNTANAQYPDESARIALLQQWDTDIDGFITTAVADEAQSAEWAWDIGQLGWGGAGIWYNKIAQLNGGFMASVANIPQVKAWPILMQEAGEENAKQAKVVTSDNAYGFTMPDGMPNPAEDRNARGGIALNEAYTLWQDAVPTEATTGAGGSTIPIHETPNALDTALSQMFGTKGLFDMRANVNIHPLAQIVIMGKYLLEAAMTNMMIGAGATGINSLAALMNAPHLPPVLVSIISSLLWTVAMMILSIGVILYYVVPFMPFLYFFFQVGDWIKTLFEAMVGLPLWALAHVRIDGEGLPGTHAMNGYYLLVDILLRPLFTIFGMLAAISIFSAQVKVLNSIFDLVVSNVAGFDSADPTTGATLGSTQYLRGYVDQLFYTVIYAVIVYMMGIASFKLIYMIPDSMLRWLGAGVQSFATTSKTDHLDGVVTKMYGSTALITSRIGSGGRSLGIG